MRLAAITLIAALGLASCASVDTSKWPTPATLQTGLTLAEAGWAAYCGVPAHLATCNASKEKAANAAAAAQVALNAYSEAYASGNVTQALLDNLNSAIAALVAIVASLQQKG